MLYVGHRLNTIEELNNTPAQFGAEIDIRSCGKKLILQHDPYTVGEEFEKWIKHYHHSMLVLNIKEEGIEDSVKSIIEKYNIKNYFYLDLSFPSLIKMINQREKKVAVRFSEYESIETAMSLAGKASWVWVDCFSRMPLLEKDYKGLAKYFNICVVSPELQGRSTEEIKEYKRQLKSFRIDAVCTKRIDLWLDKTKIDSRI